MFAVLLLLGLLITGGFGPGWWLVRRQRWSLLERFVAAVAASGVILYLTAGLLYVGRAPLVAYWAVSAVAAAFSFAAGRDVLRLVRDRTVRRALIGFGLLFGWMLLLLAMVRSYSGGKWEIDWLEHYQRMQFFLQHQPLDTLMPDGLPLPSRPPFMNLLVGFFLNQTGMRYELFQVASVWLNLLGYFPAYLLVRRFHPRAAGRTGLLALLVLMAASPMVLENSTYTWTKGLANFHVLLGLAFYVRAVRRPDAARMLAAFLALTAGVLVHYSAAPYLVLVLLHYLWRWRGRCTGWGEVARVAVACTLLLATWIGWSVATYGVQVTFGSNTTTVGAGAMTTAQNLAKIGSNLVASVVPHPLRIGWAEFSATFVQPNPWGLLRDYFFTIGQTNLLFGVGSLAWLAVLWLLWRQRPTVAGERSGLPVGAALRRDSREDSRDKPAPAFDPYPCPGAAAGERWFWLWLGAAGVVLTVATHPTEDPYGVAHVCSQPLVWVGICFLAAGFGTLPRWLRGVVIAGCAVDFLLGGLLHFSLQHWGYELVRSGGREILEFRADMPSFWAVRNFNDKESLGVTFLGDHFAGSLLALQVSALVLFALGLDLLVRAGFGRGWVARLAVLALLVVPAAIFLLESPSRARPILPNPADPVAAAAAVKADFDSADAHVNLGLVLYRQGKLGEAVFEFVQGLTLQPGHARDRYYFEVLETAYRGPVPPAVDLAEAVRADPTSALAQNDLGVELWNRGHRAVADARFREAIRLQPDFVLALNNLARSESEQGRAEAAIELLNRSLRSEPGNALTHLLLATVLAKRGSAIEAVAELRAALRLDPANAEAKTLLAQLEKSGP